MTALDTSILEDDDPFVEQAHRETEDEDAELHLNQRDAEAAGLRYVSDSEPGIRRRRAGKGFTYVGGDGETVRDAKVMSRIRALVLPPAWTDVWICRFADGHIQATGIDQKGRKQYRYHQRWRELRDEAKFGRMIAFGKALPALRDQVEKDLAKSGLPREKVIAAVVRLLETTLIRVGNRQYVKENKSFGLTTLRDRHVEIAGATVNFEFRGKSGKTTVCKLRDRRLARIVKSCREVPGQELFQYYGEDGARCPVTSNDVNQYLQDAMGQEFTAKDFRTWAGTVHAALALMQLGACDNPRKAKRNLTAAVKQVAARLNNTVAVCRKSYIHPAVMNAYLEGKLVPGLSTSCGEGETIELPSFNEAEADVLAFLEDCLKIKETAGAAH
jgi:DNA topoisomerase-1